MWKTALIEPAISSLLIINEPQVQIFIQEIVPAIQT